MAVGALLLQVTLNGVVLGLIYGLIAIGVSLIFGIMRVVQFAHGHMYMLGAMGVFYLCQRGGINYFLAVLIAAVLVAFLGVILERLFFRRMRGEELPSMVIGFGLLLFLEGSAVLAFGVVRKTVSSPIPGVIELGGIVISSQRLLIVAMALVAVVLLFLFIKRTKVGQSMQAVAQDVEAAQLQGINVDRIGSLGFGIASGLAGLAAGIIVPILDVTPSLGGVVVLKAFMVVVLGGLGSIPGALAGGLTFGFIESFGYTFVGYSTSLFGFIIVMLILLFRPRGIMGHD